MAPPGIMSLDEQLDNIYRIPSRSNNFSFNFYSSSLSPSSLSPTNKTSPSGGVGGFCPSASLVDHDYLAKQEIPDDTGDSWTDCGSLGDEMETISSIDFDDFMGPTTTTNTDKVEQRVPPSDEKNWSEAAKMVMMANTATHISTSTHQDSSDDYNMNVDDDDFLHGLDDLDLDFSYPCADVAMEDTFRTIIDDTFYDSLLDDTFDDDQDEEEDRYKKEFFLKMLGLEATSSLTQNRSSPIESCTSTSDVPNISDGVCCPTEIHSQSSLTTTTTTTTHYSSSRSSRDVHSNDKYDNKLMSFKYNNARSKSQSTPTTSIVVNPCAISVPAKTHSCVTTDGMDSLLYSTAATASVNGRVQTNLSTSVTQSPASRRLSFNCTNISEIKNNTTMSNDADNRCSDDLLQWWEEDEEESAFTSNADHYGLDNPITNSVASPISPSTVHSLSDLDSCIDLEDYVTEDDHHPRNSELRFRLSLLDDISNGIMNERDVHNTDAFGHDELCQFDFSTNDKKSLGFGNHRDYFGESNCPLSPYSSSSVHSSVVPVPSKRSEDSLDLLGLFSEENSSMLMERSFQA